MAIVKGLDVFKELDKIEGLETPDDTQRMTIIIEVNEPVKIIVERLMMDGTLKSLTKYLANKKTV